MGAAGFHPVSIFTMAGLVLYFTACLHSIVLNCMRKLTFLQFWSCPVLLSTAEIIICDIPLW